MTKNNEIVESWNGIQDVENEHSAFNEYSRAREALFEVLNKFAKGKASRSDVEEKMRPEIEAFDKYVLYRSAVKRNQ